MHADELETDAAFVRRLLTAQCPHWASLPIEPVPSGGTDNALYRLGDAMVVRLPRRERTAATLAKERRWLPTLAPHLPIAVPQPVADGMPTEDYPWRWSVYRWLEGEDATTQPLADLHQAALELAAFIEALESIDPVGGPPPGEHNFFRGGPLAARDAAVRASIVALEPELDVAAVTAGWDEALRAPTWMRPPVWIHGDLDARNVLVQGGRITGVIDWGGLGVGDPACDVMVAWKLFSGEARERFRTALCVDDATWTRSRGWALSQALIALAYYTDETNPVLVREARRWLSEAIA
jgi:aminoglycoside phosphotransferase (APT) family kinase protein